MSERAAKRAVLQVIPRLETGGAERTTLEIAAALVAEGWRAHIATAGGALCDEARAIGAHVHLMPVQSKNPWVVWRNAMRLAALARAERISLFHARSRAPAWSALRAARQVGVPFVTTYHGAYRAQSRAKRWINSVMVRGDVVIANSNFTRAALLEQYSEMMPDLAGRVATIPRGADLGIFAPEKVTPERRERLQSLWFGTGTARPVIVFILPGRLSPWKGHGIVLEALGRLGWRAADGIKVLFVGGGADTGELERRLREKITALGMDAMISLTGHCADMPAAYALADFVLVPSTRPEAFGRVAVEAGAMAIPVIASDHGGLQETIINGETGFLVSPADAGALADAMASAVAMAVPDRREMGRAARNRVAQTYTIPSMTAATLAVYRRLLQENACDGGHFPLKWGEEGVSANHNRRIDGPPSMTRRSAGGAAEG